MRYRYAYEGRHLSKNVSVLVLGHEGVEVRFVDWGVALARRVTGRVSTFVAPRQLPSNRLT